MMYEIRQKTFFKRQEKFSVYTRENKLSQYKSCQKQNNSHELYSVLIIDINILEFYIFF